MYPALFTSLLFLFSGVHFIYKGIISQKLIWLWLLLMFFFMIAGYFYKHFKWFLLKNKLTYLLILLRITSFRLVSLIFY
jgi:hypothetical protein